MILRSQFAGGVWKQWIIMSSEIAASICVRYYENFEIDDTTGKPLTRREVTDLHYDRLQLLQRVPGRHLNGPLGAAHRVDIIWRLSENSVPLNPMVFLIIIPIKWLLYNWEYTQHFQTNPFGDCLGEWFPCDCPRFASRNFPRIPVWSRSCSSTLQTLTQGRTVLVNHEKDTGVFVWYYPSHGKDVKDISNINVDIAWFFCMIYCDLQHQHVTPSK
jgi:hypothetical protein